MSQSAPSPHSTDKSCDQTRTREQRACAEEKPAPGLLLGYVKGLLGPRRVQTERRSTRECTIPHPSPPLYPHRTVHVRHGEHGQVTYLRGGGDTTAPGFT